MKQSKPTTGLCRYTDDQVFYRDKNLVEDLLDGSHGFVEVMIAHILNRDLTEHEIRVFNTILITMMEHGLTPSSIAARSVYMSAPENLQGAIAAGLLAVGSQFVGTIENNARLLARLVPLEGADREREAEAIVAEHRSRRTHIPGYGHHLHRPDDPRSIRLLELGEESQGPRHYLNSLKLLGEVIDRSFGRHMTINATGACAALMGDMDVPPEVMRGIAVIARSAGLVAHISEELERPSGRYIWEVVSDAIPFEV
ncbi:citryl-CoA lyase [Martelella lutilitoris]|uniref:citrate synthase (unknown stereospecificity) n=1 Tax=Martelella lutilitoris TaxID=2583532 RepID=A0A5C4JR60_9HYPH|nr:citryl-CoA lyase [Martelella lutilitoris]TNB47780.1 citryl-CoA lyase [Martelella lutilitoris]